MFGYCPRTLAVILVLDFQFIYLLSGFKPVLTDYVTAGTDVELAS